MAQWGIVYQHHWRCQLAGLGGVGRLRDVVFEGSGDGAGVVARTQAEQSRGAVLLDWMLDLLLFVLSVVTFISSCHCRQLRFSEMGSAG